MTDVKKRSKRSWGRAKKGTLSWYREEAWKAFSLFIRTRDSILTTGGIDRCTCVTCGKEYPRLGRGCIQAGHFIAGRNNSVLFSERGVHGQCWQCNHHNHGAPAKYLIFMQLTYGQDVVDELILQSNQTLKYSRDDYEAIRGKYRNKTEELILTPELAKLDVKSSVDSDLPF